MENKIKVLVIPSDTCGCGFYRSLRPHTKMQELYSDEFEIDIRYDFNWENLEELSKYNIVHFHKGLYGDGRAFRVAMRFCKEKGIKLVMDIDDHWELGPHHPHYHMYKNSGVKEYLTDNLRIADYVTTTTPIFAKEISKYNPNVRVFVNAIDPEEEQFIPKDKKSDKIRFGFVLGSSHQYDMELFRGVINSLPKDVLNKIQIVLCGYDLRGTVSYRDAEGKVQQRPILPMESVWYEYEKIVTDDYKIVSPEYKEWLHRFAPNSTYLNVENEPYKRCWTKDIMNYCTHYNELDVLLVPLEEHRFNSVKSELKLIEAGMMKKAVIASNFGPYQLGTKNYFEKGGVINPEGNCILIDRHRKHKDWAKAIEKLVKNPEHIETLRNNLHESIKDKYNLANVTAERVAFYKEILNKE